MPTSPPDRHLPDFPERVRDTFGFLTTQGFSESESDSTIVRFRKGGLDIDIYHGRHSYEIDAGFTAFGSRHSMSEILRNSGMSGADRYTAKMVATPEGVSGALTELASLMSTYGQKALSGEPEFFAQLRKARQQWSESFAMGVLESQIRPQAEQAFRLHDYGRAADLFGKIRSRLTDAEAEKLRIAEERRSGTQE